MFLASSVDNGAVGQGLNIVFFVLFMVFEEEVGAGRGIACGYWLGWGRRRVAAGGTQDLVLGAGTLQGSLEALVVRLQRVGAGLEGGELGLELLDMALLALTKGTLTVDGPEGQCMAGQVGEDGWSLRSAVLSFAPALSRRQVILLFTTAPRPAYPAIVEFGTNARVYATCSHGSVCCCVFGGLLLRGRQAVGETSGIVGCRKQDGVKRFLYTPQLVMVSVYASRADSTTFITPLGKQKKQNEQNKQNKQNKLTVLCVVSRSRPE